MLSFVWGNEISALTPAQFDFSERWFLPGLTDETGFSFIFVTVFRYTRWKWVSATSWKVGWTDERRVARWKMPPICHDTRAKGGQASSFLLLAYVIDEHLTAGEPICVRTRSSHCKGPLRWSSIQQGVDVTVCRLEERRLVKNWRTQSTSV